MVKPKQKPEDRLIREISVLFRESDYKLISAAASRLSSTKASFIRGVLMDKLSKPIPQT